MTHSENVGRGVEGSRGCVLYDAASGNSHQERHSHTLRAVEASFLGHGALDASIIAALRLRRTERGKNSLNQRRKG